MKRKVLSMVLATMMTAIVLFGCGSTEEVYDETTEVEEKVEEEMEEEIEESEEQDTEEADDSQNEASKKSLSAKERAATKEDEAQDKEEDKETESIQIERGNIKDGMYVNESIGITFPISDNMYVLSDEEMMQVYGAGANIVIEDDVYTPEQMEQALQGTMCDIMILFPDGRTNLSVMCENMDITANGIYMSEEFYKTVLTAQMESMQSIQYELVNEEYVELGGKEYLAIEFAVAQGSVQAKQYYYVRKEANYMIAFIASCYDGSEYMIEEVLDEVADPNT